MRDALKAYLDETETVELDPNLLQNHLKAMADEVIPAIVEDLKEAEQMAAELRYSPAVTRRRMSPI
jgi:hypothetical protein